LRCQNLNLHKSGVNKTYYFILSEDACEAAAQSEALQLGEAGNDFAGA
jgi:hypothetical protein